LPSSLTRGLPSTLGYLPPPTCVGLRYGRLQLPQQGFSWPRGSTGSPWLIAAAAPLLGRASPSCEFGGGISNATPGLPHSVPLLGLYHLQAVTEYKPFVHRLRHLALGLGPTNPTWTHLPSETLGIRWARFSRAFCYSYRHSHSHSLHRPSRDDFTARATLPYHPLGSAASVTSFSPGTLSARDHSTSELLRTLSMVAASKPTSWLSGQSHILLHLARTWGP
jgi:hypothetical protein